MNLVEWSANPQRAFLLGYVAKTTVVFLNAIQLVLLL